MAPRRTPRPSAAALAGVVLAATLAGCLASPPCQPCYLLYRASGFVDFPGAWDANLTLQALDGMGFALGPKRESEGLAASNATMVLNVSGVRPEGWTLEIGLKARERFDTAADAERRGTALAQESRALFERTLQRFEEATGWRHVGALTFAPRVQALSEEPGLSTVAWQS